MITMLKDWKGKVQIDDTLYDNVSTIKNKALKGQIHIKLLPLTQNHSTNENTKVQIEDVKSGDVRITVKPYMCKKATPEFDFMTRWNNDTPMPMRTMQGKKIKETPGMVYMQLHAQGLETITCLRCGKTLTNPISRHYGIGPECMSKLGIVADIDDVDNIKEKLVDITWEGYVIKSSILEEEEV